MEKTNSFAGKTAFVTGSSRGIGRAIALRLAAGGAQVWFHGTKDSPELESAVYEGGELARKCVGDEMYEHMMQIAAAQKARKDDRKTA